MSTRTATIPTDNPDVVELLTCVYRDIRGVFGAYLGYCLVSQRSSFFCSRCAGSHGPNDPCPAATPFFQFNNVAGAMAPPEETDNDHILAIDTWKCEGCGESNECDRFPIRCKICRRYR